MLAWGINPTVHFSAFSVIVLFVLIIALVAVGRRFRD